MSTPEPPWLSAAIEAFGLSQWTESNGTRFFRARRNDEQPFGVAAQYDDFQGMELTIDDDWRIWFGGMAEAFDAPFSIEWTGNAPATARLTAPPSPSDAVLALVVAFDCLANGQFHRWLYAEAATSPNPVLQAWKRALESRELPKDEPRATN